MENNKTACTLSGEYKRKHAPEFIKKINWSLLRKQKEDLLNTITELESNAKHANNAGNPELFSTYLEWSISLEGILSLIDYLQDYATDEMGLSDKEVFNLEEDEESN